MVHFKDVSFADALAQTERFARHLLLGNGFSIKAHRQFRYSSLADLARKRDPSIEHLLPTSNFEAAMIGKSPEDQGRLRQALIDAISVSHRHRNETLTIEQRGACGAFLAHFLRGRGKSPVRGKIFTTNYDTMLDWIVVEQVKSRAIPHCEDGFRPYDLWNPDKLDQVRVFYLHGALALYETKPGKVWKLRAKDVPGSATIDLVNRRIADGRLPLFVSEGDAKGKEKAIFGNPYLRDGYAAFESVCAERRATLFSYGHSLSEQDDHLVEAVGSGNIQNVYLGWYSHDGDRQRFKGLASRWDEQRFHLKLPPIMVHAFPLDEVAIW